MWKSWCSTGIWYQAQIPQIGELNNSIRDDNHDNDDNCDNNDNRGNDDIYDDDNDIDKKYIMIKLMKWKNQ